MEYDKKMKTVRKIISFDDSKCDGCGLCVSSCAEGAIKVVNGKARLVSESFCDGLGACLAECPRDAIRIVAREADSFDEKAVARHLAGGGAEIGNQEHVGHHSREGGCPGSKAFAIDRSQTTVAMDQAAIDESRGAASELTQWPVQLALISPHAPYWSGADLLIAADCVPCAFASFHSRLLRGRKLILACPKLDDTEPYLGKLVSLFSDNDIRSVTVAHMEVPCCLGLVRLAREALDKSGKDIPFKTVNIGIKGETLY